MTTTEKPKRNAAARPDNSTAIVTEKNHGVRSAADAADLGEIFARQRSAFARYPSPSFAERRALLLKLQRIVEQNRLIFLEAAHADFGACGSAATEIAEIQGTIRTIKYARRRLRPWMGPRERAESFWQNPAGNRLEPDPLGIVGVVSPSGLPMYLALMPAAAALAAGNRVMIKASELTPRTSAVLKRLIDENFSPDLIYATDRGGEFDEAFTKLPFDGLLTAASHERALFGHTGTGAIPEAH